MSEFDPGRRAVVKAGLFITTDLALWGLLRACAQLAPPESTPEQIESGIIFLPTPSPAVIPTPQVIESQPTELPRNVEVLPQGILYGFAQENIPARSEPSLNASLVDVDVRFNRLPKGSLLRFSPWVAVDGLNWGKIIHDTAYTHPSLIRPIATQDIYIPISSLKPLSSQDLVPINPRVDPKLKRIEISLDKQRLTAFEGDKIVFTTLVSTGISGFATEKGEYKVNRVRLSRYMAGDNYVYPGVPYNMYFNNGQALHAAYWHNNFGRRASHGCVNLPPEKASWLFRWVYVPIVREKLLGQEETWISPKDQNATLVVIK